MGFAVEAWFYNSAPEAVSELFCSGLAAAGFSGIDTLTLQTVSWECVTLSQHKVFVALGSRTEDHFVVTVQARLDWNEGYPAFEKVFIHLLNHCQDVQLAELLLSTRNPQPYPFLTHSFHRARFSPTIVDLNENRIIQASEDNYWIELGPELHFIAKEVFERTAADAFTLARCLNTEIIDLEGGVVLDCGWTNEFELPRQLCSIQPFG